MGIQERVWEQGGHVNRVDPASLRLQHACLHGRLGHHGSSHSTNPSHLRCTQSRWAPAAAAHSITSTSLRQGVDLLANEWALRLGLPAKPGCCALLLLLMVPFAWNQS